MFSYPGKKAVHPIFLLVEMTADPRQREQARNRALALLKTICETAEADSPYGLPIWIHGFGQGNFLIPEKFPKLSNPVERALTQMVRQQSGSISCSLSTALEQLCVDLSRYTFLQYDLPLVAPSIFLLGNPQGTAEEYSTLKDLDEGPWFFHCNRFVLSDSKMKCPDFANRFVGFTPRLFQKNPRILPADNCASWSIFLKDFLPEVIPAFLNTDALEGLLHVDPAASGPKQTGPRIPWDHALIGPGIPASEPPEPGDPWDLDRLGPGIPAEPGPRETGYVVPNRPADDGICSGDTEVFDGYRVPLDDDGPGRFFDPMIPTHHHAPPVGEPILPYELTLEEAPACPYPDGRIPGAGVPLTYEDHGFPGSVFSREDPFDPWDTSPVPPEFVPCDEDIPRENHPPHGDDIPTSPYPEDEFGYITCDDDSLMDF